MTSNAELDAARKVVADIARDTNSLPTIKVVKRVTWPKHMPSVRVMEAARLDPEAYLLAAEEFIWERTD